MTCSRAFLPASVLIVGLSVSAAWAEPPRKADAHASTAAKPDASARARAAASVDLPTLLGAFAKMPGLEAEFVEEKHIALLARPLESRGKLFFTHPGLLLRRVESPRPSELVITQDALRMKDERGEQTMDLRERPDLRPFVESLTWILGGNRAALESVYTLGFAPSKADEPWQLTLTPKGKPLSQLISALVIRGHGLAVETVEVRETGGDSALTRIVSANPARNFDAKERAQLFGGAKSSP